MAQTDRSTGLVGDTGIKEPVRIATTANITLSGEQTIDGVAVVDGDRVLVKEQTTAANNGIYECDTGTWTRTKDCDGSYDLVNGTLVYVRSGTTNGIKIFKCTATNPITIGTTSLSFSVVDIELTGTVKVAWCGTATGTANALVLTPSVAVASLSSGLTLLFKSGASANTSTTTIAVSGLTATAAQSNGVAMVGAEIEVSKWYMAVYEGTAFQVVRLAPAVLLEMFTTAGDSLIATADQKVARLAASASVAAHATTSDVWTARETILTGAGVTFTDIADAPYVGAVAWVYQNAAHVWTDGAVFDVQGNQNYTADIGDWVRINAVTLSTFDVTIFKANGTAVVASSAAPVFGRVVRTAGNITTTSTTLVDVTGATVTFTTGAFPVSVGCAMAAAHTSATGTNWFNIAVDGALELGTSGIAATAGVAAAYTNMSFAHQTAALTAASHTIKMQWQTGSGTGTIYASSTESFSFWAHEIR